MKFFKLLKKIAPYFYLLAYLATTVLIIIKAAETGEVSAAQSSNLAEYLKENVVGMKEIAEKSADFPTLVRKFVGHYGLFAVNGFFATLSAFSFIKKSMPAILISFLSGVIISLLSEFIQGFTDGRTLSFTDVILNVQGNISGISIALIFSLTFSFKNNECFLKNLKSYLIFILISIVTILIYCAFSKKSESVEVCTIVEIIVVSFWLLIEGIYLIFKRKKLN